jgi:hypothetical protein
MQSWYHVKISLRPTAISTRTCHRLSLYSALYPHPIVYGILIKYIRAPVPHVHIVHLLLSLDISSSLLALAATDSKIEGLVKVSTKVFLHAWGEEWFVLGTWNDHVAYETSTRFRT